LHRRDSEHGVVAHFNTAGGWSRDVTLEIADEVARRFAEHDEVLDSILQFVEAHRPALKIGTFYIRSGCRAGPHRSLCSRPCGPVRPRLKIGKPDGAVP